mmetsp:Transcript_34916/g.86686  ORF Transcript_34916/g.86686 Transcript_34916/m.86686 type:complete len:251 (+) Transcript_34916:553-1305(+)
MTGIGTHIYMTVAWPAIHPSIRSSVGHIDVLVLRLVHPVGHLALPLQPEPIVERLGNRLKQMFGLHFEPRAGVQPHVVGVMQLLFFALWRRMPPCPWCLVGAHTYQIKLAQVVQRLRHLRLLGTVFHLEEVFSLQLDQGLLHLREFQRREATVHPGHHEARDEEPPSQMVAIFGDECACVLGVAEAADHHVALPGHFGRQHAPTCLDLVGYLWCVFVKVHDGQCETLLQPGAATLDGCVEVPSRTVAPVL